MYTCTNQYSYLSPIHHSYFSPKKTFFANLEQGQEQIKTLSLIARTACCVKQVQFQTGFYCFTEIGQIFWISITLELLHNHYNMETDIDKIILIQGKWLIPLWHFREPKSKTFSWALGRIPPDPPTPHLPFTANTFGAHVIENKHYFSWIYFCWSR